MTKKSYGVQNISEKVWKLPAEANMYFLDFDKKIIIDTSDRQNRRLLDMFLAKVVDFEKIDYVIFTHLHLDHIGNFDAFPNAQFFASKIEIEDFEKDPLGATGDALMAEKLKQINLQPIEDLELPNDLELIHTPGHTRGSIALWYPEKKILFSGDTIFPSGIGRLDLPTSVPHQMQESLNQLTQYNFKILCAGHDYGL